MTTARLSDLELLLSSPDLDTEMLRLHRLDVVERISHLFEMKLEVVAIQGHALDLDEASGANLSVIVSEAGQESRRFTGIITHITQLPAHAVDGEVNTTGYRLIVHPRAWLATLVETLDIHLDKTLVEIVEQKLKLFDLVVGDDFDTSLLTHDYPRRLMTVQYKETDLSLLARLCEHWGVFFYVDHRERDRLVFGDDAAAYRPIGDDEAVSYRMRGDERGIHALTVDRALIPAHYVCRDYNDQTPALELSAQHDLEQGFAGGVIEYGSDFLDKDQGAWLARVRAEEQLSRRHVVTGEGDDPRFAPGHHFTLQDHPQHDGKLVLLTVTHQASQPVGGWGDADETVRSYRNQFSAIDAEISFRPPRATRIPRIHGLVTGVVESSQGDLGREARLDDQGRYTVRFLFDTAAPGERKASCPVRMMQPSAGPGYGMHFPLKPGVEVMIAFVDGNPDRPILLGAVPNPITPTPVNAPVATKSRIKTRSGIVIEFDDADRG